MTDERLKYIPPVAEAIDMTEQGLICTSGSLEGLDENDEYTRGWN